MAKKKPEYTEKDLIAAIKDMNKVLDCDPPLELEDDMEMTDLIDSFKEGAEMSAPGDKFAKGTVALAGKLEVALGEAEEPEEEEEEKEEKVEEKKDTKKDKKKKKPATKKDTKKADKKDTPKKEKKAAAKDKAPKYKRITAFCEVVKKMPKKGLTIEDITERTNTLCEKNGLTVSAKFESVCWTLNYCLLPLVGMDVVEYDKEKKIYTYTA